MKKKNNSKNKKIIIAGVAGIVLIGSAVGYKLYSDNQVKIKAELKKKMEQAKLDGIKANYSTHVVTRKKTKLYNLELKEVGEINKDQTIELAEMKITLDTTHFKITSLDEEYLIKYQDVVVSEAEKLIKKNERYKRYIPFNENIVTNDKTSFYRDNELLFTLNKSFDLPVYIKDDEQYGVVYNDELLYVKKEDVKEVKVNTNSSDKKATRVATVLYHFLYANGDKCDQGIICHSESQMDSHVAYLKENNYFTLTMKEYEQFIDGKLNVPVNSVLITLDDGVRADFASQYFTKNEINASFFIVSAWFDPKIFETDYVESHSHGYDLHQNWKCPTNTSSSQGGLMLCMDYDKLIADLNKSRELTNMTTAFSYPFYDINDRAIKVLKETGFTMAFVGDRKKATVGYNKFKLPRYTILSSDTKANFASYISGW